MAENPFDPENERLIQEKSNFTLSAGSLLEIFHWGNEDGWVSEVMVKCNSPNLILELNFGNDIDSMKIQDAQDYGMNTPNNSFWVSSFGGGSGGDIYVMAFHPRNPSFYNGSVALRLKNETASDITINKVIFKRIKMKPTPSIPGPEYAPYGVQW